MRALLPYSAGVSEKDTLGPLGPCWASSPSCQDLRAIFDRYAEEASLNSPCARRLRRRGGGVPQGLLPIRPFAAEFTSGVRREANLRTRALARREGSFVGITRGGQPLAAHVRKRG